MLCRPRVPGEAFQSHEAENQTPVHSWPCGALWAKAGAVGMVEVSGRGLRWPGSCGGSPTCLGNRIAGPGPSLTLEKLINESYFKLKYIPSMVRDILKLDKKKKVLFL